MKRTSLLNKIFSVAFAVTVMFTVSVREVHYLFSQHEAHERCENHLHNSNHQEDCSICKFDVSIFTDTVFSFDNSAIAWLEKSLVVHKQSLNLQSSTLNLLLRGPPVTT